MENWSFVLKYLLTQHEARSTAGSSVGGGSRGRGGSSGGSIVSSSPDIPNSPSPRASAGAGPASGSHGPGASENGGPASRNGGGWRPIELMSGEKAAGAIAPAARTAWHEIQESDSASLASELTMGGASAGRRADRGRSDDDNDDDDDDDDEFSQLDEMVMAE